MRDFIARPHQQVMIDFMLANPRSAVWCFMGGGKTSATWDVLDRLLLSGEVRKPLVLGPLRVARGTWPNECKKWNQFERWSVQPITGNLEERKAALRNDKADVYTINYENLPTLVDHLGEGNWPFDMVVADESTRCKNLRLEQGGVRAGALRKIAHTKVRRWVNLTGTPAPNGLQDLWGQMWFIDEGTRLGRTYSAFENRWFGFQRAKDALNAHKTYVKRVVFPHAQAEIQNLLRDVCLTLDPKDWFDLKDPIVRDVVVDLPPVARKHYKEMENAMFTELDGIGVEAFNAASKTIKCLQLAAGAAYLGEGDPIDGVSPWTEVHDEKLQALESIIEEAGGMPITVAYHFKPDLVRLKARFKNARLISTVKDEDDFKAGRIPIALVHAQSIGHGVDGFQDVTNILVFFTRWWARETHDQLIERIGPMRQMQSGHDRPVFIYNIVARNTVDEDVGFAIREKRSVEDALMSAMKRRKE